MGGDEKMNNFDKSLNLKFVRFSHKLAILFNLFEECLVFICLQNISWPSDKIKIYDNMNLFYEKPTISDLLYQKLKQICMCRCDV